LTRSCSLSTEEWRTQNCSASWIWLYIDHYTRLGK